VSLLFEILDARDEAALLASLERMADWAAASGLDYSGLAGLLVEFRRVLTPAILRHVSPGPELELVFPALDSLERAVLASVAEAAIERARQQVVQLGHQRAVSHLTGGMAHSVNNTFAVIIGRAQILEEELDDERVSEELRGIQASARAGADSLRRLQQFAAGDGGRPPERLDLNALVSDVVQLTRFRWRDDAEANGIVVDVVKDLAPVPAVLGYPALVRDALVELVLNSVEAMPDGGLVTVRTERSEDRVRVSVIDLGQGMGAEARARALDPLFTTKGPDHPGLGLVAVTEILRRHGSVLEITSEPGRGTTVSFSLPVAPVLKQAAEPEFVRLARWANVLVVDDEPHMREVALRAFKARGFHAVAADSGAEAIRLFKDAGPFQVVICDLGMPGMNGFDTARELKRINPRSVVILMTGWGAELDQNKMRESGIDRAIQKPFDIEEVLRLTNEALGLRDRA
jgi:signal transduction histidine kinase/ActR/RegA family two-component response regulator